MKLRKSILDIIILTEEDYRTEDPKKYVNKLPLEIKNNANYEIIIDRQQAINKAIKIAKKGDVVVLTGKAHEKSLCRGKTEYLWDEYEAVKLAIKLLNIRLLITVKY